MIETSNIYIIENRDILGGLGLFGPRGCLEQRPSPLRLRGGAVPLHAAPGEGARAQGAHGLAGGPVAP